MQYDFFISPKAGRVVIYTEAINGNSYCSIHKCGDMPEMQAKTAFHREHKKEVVHLVQTKLLQQNLKNETHSNS